MTGLWFEEIVSYEFDSVDVPRWERRPGGVYFFFVEILHDELSDLGVVGCSGRGVVTQASDLDSTSVVKRGGKMFFFFFFFFFCFSTL